VIPTLKTVAKPMAFKILIIAVYVVIAANSLMLKDNVLKANVRSNPASMDLVIVIIIQQMVVKSI